MIFYKKSLILIIGSILLMAVLLISLLFTQRGQEIKEISPKTIDKSSPFKDYTNMNFLKPGIHTEADVEKILGMPKTITHKGDKKYLLYDTPFNDFGNFVVLRDGKVEYALENVFGNYRGNLDDYRKMCGKEDRVYYEDGDDGEWYVFLKCGVAVDVFEFTRQVFYFIPQNEVSFLKNFSGELKMQKEPPEEDIETFIPAP